MIKNTIIAILTGITIAQRITPPGHPARVAVILIIAGMVYKAMTELENLWDKHVRIRQGAQKITSAVSSGLRQISRQACSRVRWWRICLRTWPAELAQRRRRRQMIQGYIQRLRNLPLEKRGHNLEESETTSMEEMKTVSSMDGIAYLKAKLYRQPERFREQYYNKEWAAAKNTYDTAVKVAMFMELTEEERNKLFGSRQVSDGKLRETQTAN